MGFPIRYSDREDMGRFTDTATRAYTRRIRIETAHTRVDGLTGVRSFVGSGLENLGDLMHCQVANKFLHFITEHILSIKGSRRSMAIGQSAGQSSIRTTRFVDEVPDGQGRRERHVCTILQKHQQNV